MKQLCVAAVILDDWSVNQILLRYRKIDHAQKK